ncbi:MAG: hypothetical protein AAF205_00205 [Pseudomonadota bacterium]
MTNAKHTPGPWRQTAKHPRQICDPHGRKVAKCLLETRGFHGSALPDGEAEANARLIAAAPDLYGALGELIEAWSWWQEDPVERCGSVVFEGIQDGLAALAKARGEIAR